MNRGQCMEALLGLGVDSPEQASNEIPTEAVAGVVRWALDQNKKGRAPDSGIIVYKLRNGGLAGYGQLRGPVEDWWRTWQGRERWLERNVLELDTDDAENAVISLLQAKREPTIEAVREWTQLAQQQDLAHDEKCRRAVEGQRKLSGRERRVNEAEKARGTSQRAESVAPRPESVREATAEQKEETQSVVEAAA